MVTMEGFGWPRNLSSTGLDDVFPSAAPGVSSPEHPPVFGSVILLAVILTGIAGNVLVCLAVTRSRSLRSVAANRYVVSLAVADVLVCAIVMPLALYVEFTGGMWTLPSAVCKIWNALDILLSTASILHLCAISIDRFHAINSPIRYMMTRTTPRMAFRRIAGVWALSALVSSPAFFLFDVRDGRCMLQDDTNAYLWASSSVSFYIPCAVILVVYFRIYHAARRRARRAVKPAAVSVIGRQPASPSQEGDQEEALATEGSSPASAAAPGNLESLQSTGPETSGPGVHDDRPAESASLPVTRADARLQRTSLAQERKAARTIGIVVGAFIVCWLPFFVQYSVFSPMCAAGLGRLSCSTVQTVSRVSTWVGWCNSSVNPVIYTVFNQEFRLAFKKLLRCRKNP